ncbi:MAG TPA: NADPH-dependent FMN reductase [Thermoleophilaceae bacterium]
MKVLGISGSLRSGSHNTALLRAAQRLAPQGTQLELYEELELIPPYNEDRDGDAAPAAATRLRELVAGADAVLFATPEYNGSTPGQLKNALDWLSRPRGEAAIHGKTVAVIGATTGAYGGIWAQAELRKSLGIAGARVVDAELAIGKAGEHLYADGEIVDVETHECLTQVLADLAAGAEPLAVAA